MANKIGKIIAIVLIIAVLICAVGVALLPLVLVVGTIYCRRRFTRIKSGLRNHLSDFWLNDEEKKEFKSIFIKREEYKDIVAKAEQEAKEAGIHMNKDGQYSTRSNLGKKIRKTYDDYLPIIEEIMERLQELEEQPL
jgi:hypothetical protein